MADVCVGYATGDAHLSDRRRCEPGEVVCVIGLRRQIALASSVNAAAIRIAGQSIRVSLINDESSALNLRYFCLWNPSNRDEDIVAITVRSARDTNLGLLCQIRSHEDHELVKAFRLAEHVGPQLDYRTGIERHDPA